MRVLILFSTFLMTFMAFGQGLNRDVGPRNINPSRIIKPKDPNARCSNTRGISQSYCESKRKHALEIGCITQNEYEQLRQFGSTPSCDEHLALEKVNSGRVTKGLPPKSFDQLTSQEKLHQLITWCPCGCFHPGSKISVVINDHHQTRRAGTVAKYFKKYELLHLREDSKRDYFTYASKPIRISTMGKESAPLFHIHTENNKTLRLTKNHPVLLSDMTMIKAKNVKVGMKLVTQKGEPVKVIQIQKKLFKGNVVNFSVDTTSDNPIEHVIFSDGMAVGDQYWQSLIDHEEDRIRARLL